MTFSPQINFEDLKLPNELWGPADIVFCLREAREKGFEEFLKRAESVTRGRVAGRHYVDRLIRLLIFKIDSADYDRELNL